MEVARFEWDLAKDLENRRKHGVSFSEAQLAFVDACRIIGPDVAHSSQEPRYFCIGRLEQGILTVRFTLRGGAVRIIGAGYWREGRKTYEKENPIES